MVYGEADPQDQTEVYRSFKREKIARNDSSCTCYERPVL